MLPAFANIRHCLRTAGDDAPGLRVRALAALVVTAFDRAVDLLTVAVEREPSASRYNDLSAALLLRAGDTGRVEDLAAALDHAARAVALDADLVEARINVAFALESLGFRHAASKAWAALANGETVGLADAYLREEAPADVSEDCPNRRRGEALLGLWAERRNAGDGSAAAAALTEATSIGRNVAARGDTTLLESAVAISEALGGLDVGARRRLRALESGHAGFYKVRGEAVYSVCDSAALGAAAGQLKTAGTPFEAWVQIDRAICDYFAGDFGRSARRLDRTLERWGTTARVAIVGRGDALLGLITMLQGRYAAADNHFRRALEHFAVLGEVGQAIYLQGLRARNLTFSGLAREAWSTRLRALRGLKKVKDRERRTTIVQDAVQALRRERRPWGALAALDEQIHWAEETAAQPGGEQDLVAYSYIERATLLAQFGRKGDALVELGRAGSVLQQIPESQEIYDTIAVELELARAMIDGGEPRSVDRALAHYLGRASGVGNRTHIVRLRRMRADLSLRKGDLAAAERDLEEGLDEVESQRRSIPRPVQRARYAGYSRDLVDSLVRLKLDERRDPLSALAALERGAGRLSYDLTAPRAHPLEASVIAEVVPLDGLLVRWGHLSDRLLIWSVDPKGGTVLETRPIGASDLRRLVTAFRDAVRDHHPRADRNLLGSRLAELVLPVRLSRLKQGAMVMLIPDSELQAVPFAALPLASGFLIERHPLAVSPNLSVLLQAPARLSAEARGELLVVADPAFDLARFPSLARLPGAAAAAELAASGAVTVLAGEAATQRSVLDALPRHRVFHAAAHGIVDNAFPDRGGILVAADPDDPEAQLLSASDLDGRDLGSLEIVILAACRTALGAVPESAEYAGLAAAFLAVGVPAVVTAAWEIDDASASRLFAAVHRRLAAGEPIVEAVRGVQVESLYSSDPTAADPGFWAAFQVYLGRSLTQR